MRVITLNVNGIRSAAEKGFVRWMQRQKADVVCVQEIRAHEHQLARTVSQPRGFSGYFAEAEKSEFSGVAIFSRHEPDQVIRGFGWEDIDAEGRMVRADFGNLTVMSFYMPSGSELEDRQKFKLSLMDRLLPYLNKLRGDGRDYIICGDLNIAHKEMDLTNDKANRMNSGFLVEECAWLDRVFETTGFHDAFRVVNQAPDQYTWWSSRGQAWQENVGWRIDYQIVSESLKDKVVEASIYKKRRFSDHAPLTVDYAYALETESALRL